MKNLLIAFLLNLGLASLAQTATITVTTTADIDALDATCSFREAIIAVNNGANYNGCNGSAFGTADTINFSVPTPAILTPTIGSFQGANPSWPSISNPVTINGLGEDNLILDGSNSVSSSLSLLSDDIHINNLTVRNSIQLGIAISGSNSSLNHVTVSNNRGFVGAGIQCANADNVNLNNVVLRDNIANSGPGGGLQLTGCTNLSLTNSALLNNSATAEHLAFGGGVAVSQNSHDFTMRDTTVTGNTAKQGAGLQHCIICYET